jgi:hypothetical protein
MMGKNGMRQSWDEWRTDGNLKTQPQTILRSSGTKLRGQDSFAIFQSRARGSSD